MNLNPTTSVAIAANDNPGGSVTVDLAITGLLGLLARAEVRREAAKQPANDTAIKMEYRA